MSNSIYLTMALLMQTTVANFELGCLVAVSASQILREQMSCNFSVCERYGHTKCWRKGGLLYD